MDTQQQQDSDSPDQQRLTEKPEVTDEHKAQAKEMAKAYQDDRPTTTMPGTGGTVSGTAVADWPGADGGDGGDGGDKGAEDDQH